MDRTLDMLVRKQGSNWSQRLPRYLLGVTMLVTGGCGLIAEYLISTVSSYCLGNTIEQFSIIIGLMMLFMGMGAMAQSHFSDEGLIQKFVGVEILLALLAGFSPLILFAAYGSMEDHFKLVLYSLAAAIGFLIGLEIPFAVRINSRYAESLGINLSDTISWDYAGSFVGAILWVAVFLRNYPLTEIGFLISFCNLTVAMVTLGYFYWQRQITRPFPLLALMLIASIALAMGYSQNRAWSLTLEQRLYEEPIIYSQTTRYQRLVVTHEKAVHDTRLYINGNLQFSSVDEAIYHEALVHPAMQRSLSRERVLILGGGDGLALREVLKYPEVRNATLVDLDPDMITAFSQNPFLCKLNSNSLKDARVHTHVSPGIRELKEKKPIFQETGKIFLTKNGRPRPEVEEIGKVSVYTIDADRFVSDSREKWGVIIVDLPDPNSIELAKLYSREFYRKLYHALAPGGVVSIQSTSPYHSKEAYLCIGRTLQASGFHTLPYHQNVPSFGDWGWYLAWKPGYTKHQVKQQVENQAKFAVPTRYFTPALFQASQAFGKDALTAQHQEVSSLMRPVILQYYTQEGWSIE